MLLRGAERLEAVPLADWHGPSWVGTHGEFYSYWGEAVVRELKNDTFTRFWWEYQANTTQGYDWPSPNDVGYTDGGYGEEAHRPGWAVYGAYDWWSHYYYAGWLSGRSHSHQTTWQLYNRYAASTIYADVFADGSFYCHAQWTLVNQPAFPTWYYRTWGERDGSLVSCG
jgi:hypothetical protein